MTAEALARLRAGYAHAMVAAAGGGDPALEAAFAAVRREDFMPAGPWTVLRIPGGRETLAVHDPTALYPQAARPEVLVVLDAARGINNGSPALHALMLHQLAVRPGDRVLHVGAGTGYYTALLAELAGRGGAVTAVEFEPRLAAQARANLRPWPWVVVAQGDGADFPAGTVDRIYVNFAVADPVDAWFDRLADGGTLVFPLGVGFAPGVVLCITRRGDGFAARHVSPCGFIGAEGRLAGDAAHRARLQAALESGGAERIASLHRPPACPAQAWFHCARWTLSPDPPG